MKKSVDKRKMARTKIDDLSLRGMASNEMIAVVGGIPHECVTASGADCEGDDCGPIPVGSHCGP